MSREESDALLAACPPELRLVVVGALDAGSRLGELLALDWTDVDLTGRQLRVVESKNNETRLSR